MEIDLNTDFISEGSSCRSHFQSELADKALKLKERIRATECELSIGNSVNNGSAQILNARLRSAFEQLSEIEDQQRDERKERARLNRFRFPEQYGC